MGLTESEIQKAFFARCDASQHSSCHNSNKPPTHANAWLYAPLFRRQYIVDNQDTLSIKNLRKLLEGDLGREQGALNNFKTLLRDLVDQVCQCRPFPSSRPASTAGKRFHELGQRRSQSRVTTRPWLPSAGTTCYPCGMACSDKGPCA